MTTFDVRYFLHQAKQVRKRCIDAHNLTFKESGHSVLWEVRRDLEPEVNYGLESPIHLLLSSYAFFGRPAIGGNRQGLARRVDRLLSDDDLSLYRALTLSEFSAVVGVDKTRLRTVGPQAGRDVEVAFATDGGGESLELTPGEYRAGWLLKWQGKTVLMFSIALDERAGERLEISAAKNRWFDEVDGEVQSVEYERDVLSLAIEPKYGPCGLVPFFFLPPSLRRSFPKRFRRQIPYELTRYFRLNSDYWHVRIAKLGSAESFSEDFDEVRRRAGRSISGYGRPEIARAALRRLLADQDIYAMLGLNEDGSVRLKEFPPLNTHTLGLVGLEEEWLKEQKLSAQTTVHQARRELQSADEEVRAHFENALQAHEVRLRWVSLMEARRRVAEARPEGLLEHLPHDSSTLEPDYAELRSAATEVFGHVIEDLPISALALGRGTKRIEAALRQAFHGNDPERVVRVGDLPAKNYELLNLDGIGAVSAEKIADALRDLLLEWPVQFTKGVGSRESAKQEIESGLDELAALFGD